MSEGLDQLSFEQAVDRLESLVSAMENGGLSLDECLERFQEAVALSRHCAARLEGAEKQIAMLTESGACLPFTPALRTPDPGESEALDW